MSRQVDVLAVLAEFSAVLEKHGASLFFSAPATLWMDGDEIGEVWNSDDSCGEWLVLVDPDAALARCKGGE